MTPHAVVAETQTRTCGRHGDYLARQWRDHWTGCPKCSDEAAEKARAEERERDRIERVDHLLRCSEIPTRFNDATFASVPAQLRDWVARLISGQGVGPAMLVGHVGTGKTHAACATLAHVIRARSCAGRFTTPSEFGRLIRDQWTARKRTEASIVEQYAGAPMLVLDDLGAQRPVDTELLQELIGARYAGALMHATVITSNLAVENLTNAIGERAADRIREGSVVIAMTGASRRLPSCP